MLHVSNTFTTFSPCSEDAFKSSKYLLSIKVKIRSYFSAARKIPDAQSALNSGSHESRK